MEQKEDIKEYRKQQSLELINKYKDLIKKTFEVADKDLLQEKIDTEDKEESEQKYLDAIKKRRIALDEVDIMLEKIEKLEQIFNDGEAMEGNAPRARNYIKDKARKTNP